VKFTEINLFGVYVAPMSVMMVAAWFVAIVIRRAASHFGLLRYVWHPALFVFGPLSRQPAMSSRLLPRRPITRARRACGSFHS
jgi:hypothetical protein